MSEPLQFVFDVSGENFTSAGEASVTVKKNLRMLGFPPDVIRRVAIAMYEGEINMVIHAGGGIATVTVFPDKIEMVLDDSGPGIADIELAMRVPNMKRNTDSMKIESELGKGTKITMTVNT